MPPEPVPADPGPDHEPAWPARDPMTAEEREAWLDHPAASGDPPKEEDEQDWDAEPLTAAELAEIGEAAADEMLAAGATAHAGDRPGPDRRTRSHHHAGLRSPVALAVGP